MKKSSKTKIAKTYALALFEAAQKEKSVQSVWKDIEKLEALLKGNTEVVQYLANPLWKEEDKISVLNKIAQNLKLRQETHNCLKIILENHRISDLALILEIFKNVYYQKNNIVEVMVDTVQPLTEKQDKQLKTSLKKLLANDVVVDYRINPSVLGGLRIQSGSKMFDDSLSAKLNYLENMMKGK